MRNEQEIRKLAEELSKLTGFIGEFGSYNQVQNKDVRYACDIHDCLSWVQGETSTESFITDAYINLDQLKHIAKSIEIRTGKKLAEYE